MKMYLCAQCHMAIKDNIKLTLVKEAPEKRKCQMCHRLCYGDTWEIDNGEEDKSDCSDKSFLRTYSGQFCGRRRSLDGD